MKKLFLQILLLPFFLLLYFEAENVLYKGFLVYFNEEDAYMRVGYTYNGQYNVVDVKYQSVTGEEDGYNYASFSRSKKKLVICVMMPLLGSISPKMP